VHKAIPAAAAVNISSKHQLRDCYGVLNGMKEIASDLSSRNNKKGHRSARLDIIPSCPLSSFRPIKTH